MVHDSGRVAGVHGYGAVTWAPALEEPPTAAAGLPFGRAPHLLGRAPVTPDRRIGSSDPPSTAPCPMPTGFEHLLVVSVSRGLPYRRLDADSGAPRRSRSSARPPVVWRRRVFDDAGSGREAALTHAPSPLASRKAEPSGIRRR